MFPDPRVDPVRLVNVSCTVTVSADGFAMAIPDWIDPADFSEPSASMRKARPGSPTCMPASETVMPPGLKENTLDTAGAPDPANGAMRTEPVLRLPSPGVPMRRPVRGGIEYAAEENDWPLTS